MIDGMVDLDRRWKYVEPDENDEPIEIVVTEFEILRDFFPWWSSTLRSMGRAHKISPRGCVEDFVITNWATPA